MTMVNLDVYRVSHTGGRVLIKSTNSAREACALRDEMPGEVLVHGPNGTLADDELDRLAAAE